MSKILSVGALSERIGIKLGTNIPEMSKQCFATSDTMLCHFMGLNHHIPDIAKMSLDEFNRGLNGVCIAKGIEFNSGRYSWDIHETFLNALLKPFTIHAVGCSYEKIKAQIDAGFPVVMGIDIQTIFNATRSLGHVILCIGYNDKGLYFNDPYGDATTVYEKTNGAAVFYSYDFLAKLLPLNFPMFLIKG